MGIVEIPLHEFSIAPPEVERPLVGRRPHGLMFRRAVGCQCIWRDLIWRDSVSLVAVTRYPLPVRASTFMVSEVPTESCER